MLNCCHLALVLAGANIITLAIFAEYTIKIRKAQIKLERKNGAEQKQLNELKEETKLLEAQIRKLKERQKPATNELGGFYSKSILKEKNTEDKHD